MNRKKIPSVFIMFSQQQLLPFFSTAISYWVNLVSLMGRTRKRFPDLKRRALNAFTRRISLWWGAARAFTRLGLIQVLVLLCLAPGIAAQESPDVEKLFQMPFDKLLNVPIVTASRYQQRVEDAPALVTIITAQEIEVSGARTLTDLLRTVPGFHFLQDINEHVVSVRGVYTSTNQKILILRDGHRLNEALWENFEPDYSISLTNIERIEILRGPGASLYGNAALTGVINIITKKAAEANGIAVQARGGNFGQRGADITVGRRWNGGDIFLWGSFTSIEGEEVDLEASEDYYSPEPTKGKMYVDKFEDNFDLGIRLNEGNFTLSGSIRRSNYAQPKGNLGQTIDWDQQWHDLEQTFLYSYLDLEYRRTLQKVDHSARFYYDNYSLDGWQLLATKREAPPWGKLFEIATSSTRLGFEYVAKYVGKKNILLAGFKVERWELVDSYMHQNWDNFDTMVRPEAPLLPPGTEYNGAVFVQIERAVSQYISINAGARYDYFEGFGGSFNPRLAVIARPASGLTFKLMYGSSFQAPSYFYRESNPGLGYGSASDLKPEKMKMFQVAARLAPQENWFCEVNAFYNRLNDLINRDNSLSPPSYRNFGEMTVWGIELESRLNLGKFSLFANGTYMKPVEDKTDETLTYRGTLRNLPTHTVNIGTTYYLLPSLSTNLILNWNGRVFSATPVNLDNELDDKILVDLTIRWKKKDKALRVSLSIHNLFGTEYMSSGTVPPYRQQGRWVCVTLGYGLQ